MVIEKLLGEKRVPQYRQWKRKVRRNSGNMLSGLQLGLSDRSLRRFFDKEFTPLFICGISGSGTTLLSALLEQEYEIEITIRESDRHPMADARLWLDKTETYGELGGYEEAIRLNDNINPQNVRKAKLLLYRRLISYPRKTSVILDKAPNSHMLRIEKLMLAFPTSKAVLIYRDPVEVIEGLQRKWPRPFGSASIESLANFWIELHTRFLEQSDRSKQSRKIFSYQSLVDHSQEITSLIARDNNLDLRKTPLALRDKENKIGKGIRNVSGGKIQIVKNAGDESRKRMSQEKVRIIEKLCEAMFARLEQASNNPKQSFS